MTALKMSPVIMLFM